VLKQAGNVTGMAGKWRQMGELAGDWGFDDYRMSDAAESPSRIFGYFENGKHVKLEPGTYYPDVQQAYALDWLRRHKDQTFFFYYSSHLVHDPIVATPDTKPGEKARTALYDDNVKYLDKQVGELVAEIDKLGLRERTLIVFAGDNGSDPSGGRFSTIGGRRLSGGKRDLLEGGALVPLIVNWKVSLPGDGRVVHDLVSFTDFLPTFAEIAGAPLPTGIALDGRTFAPQLLGQAGSPREWVFVQFYDKWYVRTDRWKMNWDGEMHDNEGGAVRRDGRPAGLERPRRHRRAQPSEGDHRGPQPRRRQNRKDAGETEVPLHPHAARGRGLTKLSRSRKGTASRKPFAASDRERLAQAGTQAQKNWFRHSDFMSGIIEPSRGHQTMVQIVAATFKDGVFKPDQRPALSDSARVRLVVETIDSGGASDELARREESWSALQRLWNSSRFNSGGDRLNRQQLHERP
jgi:hypothetical protein